MKIVYKFSFLRCFNVFLSAFENGAAAHTAKADFVLAAPNLYAIAQQQRNLPQYLAVFDTNGDGIIDENEERICIIALDAYCNSKNVDKSRMVGLLRSYSLKNISLVRPSSPSMPMFKTTIAEEQSPQVRLAPAEHHVAIANQRPRSQQSSGLAFTAVLLQL